VFCDGDFWHGRNWSSLKSKLETGTNADYWSSKIATNRRRDQRVDAELKEAGWRVVRLWEGDVLKHPDRVAAKVYRIVNSRLQQYGDKADND
jgi:DNA mismatch endonuclease (patch repair protein)